jgi:ribonuclease HIII
MLELRTTAYNKLESYLSSLTAAGCSSSDIKENKFSYEAQLKRGSEKLKLVIYFGKKGITSVLQGNKESNLYREVSSLVYGTELFESTEEFSEPENYIGTDESGKGDYFGPLVIAGVAVDKQSSVQLKNAGVKDSKLLNDRVMADMAPVIRKILNNKYNLIVITPATYNKLYNKMGNVNRILGWGHAKVIENLLEKHEVPEAISDKFGDEKLIQGSLQEKGKQIRLHQFTKAERYIAVAAASILARERFARWFIESKDTVGFELPKGASSRVDEIAREIKETRGAGFLSEIAKIHFKTTNKL